MFSGLLINHTTFHKTQTDSQSGCVDSSSGMQLPRKHWERLTPCMHFQVPLSVMQLLRTQRDRHTSWMCFLVLLISHTTSQETWRWTHPLDMFSRPLISHATSQNTQRKTHKLISGPFISRVTSQKTYRQTHPLDSVPLISHVTS